jgi:hypothetical protein
VFSLATANMPHAIRWRDLDALEAHCRRVAGNMETMTYAEKRDLSTALDVRVLLSRADYKPRREFSADYDGILTGTDPGFGEIAGRSVRELR